MPEIKREDLVGQLIDATLKPMPTGEIVARLRTQVPGVFTKRVSTTKAAQWSDVDNPPWQNIHRHEGLTEGYLVTSGAMIAVQAGASDGLTGPTATLLRPFEVIVFKPQVVHNVLLGPGAEIVVFPAGIPVLNQDMDCPQDRFLDSFSFDHKALASGLVKELLAH